RIGRNLDDVGTAVTRRQLHDAQAVALGIEPHSLGVDRNRATVAAEVRQIATMQSDGHGVPDNRFKANSARWRGWAAYQPIARVLSAIASSGSVTLDAIALFHGAQERTRTSTAINHWYLKPARLPIPPPGQAGHR